MTTLQRIPAPRALAAVTKLAEKLGVGLCLPAPDGRLGEISAGDVALVGSLRRGRVDVHDVDLIAPMPAGSEDPLYDRIRETFGDTKEAAKNPLFGAVAAPVSDWGRVVKGLNRNFKTIELAVKLRGSTTNPDPAWSTPFELKLEIHRYTPGERGWIEMMRTGPGGLSEEEVGWGPMILIRWKQRVPGSKGGLSYPDGSKLHAPDEDSVFRAVGISNWIPPAHRTVQLAKQLANARRTA